MAGGNCTCAWNVDFSESDSCVDNLCLDGGVEPCSAIVCKDSIATITVDPATTTAGSGRITDVTFAPTEKAYTFFARENSMQATSQETFDVDANTKDIAEAVVGQGLGGSDQTNWMRAYLGRPVVKFMLDKCGKVRAYGWNGGLKLIDFTDDTGAQKGDFVGINYTFSNTQDDGFIYVDWSTATVNGAGTFTSGQEFIDALVA